MKKILVRFADRVDVESINNSSIVGINFGGTKCYVLEKSEEDFISIQLSDQNLLTKWSASTKKEYVKEALKQISTDAFVFESQKELLTWLLKD